MEKESIRLHRVGRKKNMGYPLRYGGLTRLQVHTSSTCKEIGRKIQKISKGLVISGNIPSPYALPVQAVEANYCELPMGWSLDVSSSPGALLLPYT